MISYLFACMVCFYLLLLHGLYCLPGIQAAMPVSCLPCCFPLDNVGRICLSVNYKYKET